MKIIIAILCALFLMGCALPSPEPTLRTRTIDTGNFWNYLNITIVEISPIDGVKLQVYAVNPDAVFRDVFISYTIFVNEDSPIPQARLMRLERSGRGSTESCMRVYPRITAISGTIEYMQK